MFNTFDVVWVTSLFTLIYVCALFIFNGVISVGIHFIKDALDLAYLGIHWCTSVWMFHV